uniref:Uncharacterized protein n=1 Tax=Manihot esculenta TaxID=3983 RepID=A0A2C9U2W0_MANES
MVPIVVGVNKEKTNQRIRAFLWQAIHNGILSNLERYRRHLGAHNNFPICEREVECLLHILRDCSYVR